VKTRRFDTDVPRKFFDVVSDMESEMHVPPGEHIYGQANIWPFMQQMYEGYIARPALPSDRDGWRSVYAAVAFLAGKYDVARVQLEALGWNPWPNKLTGWGVDLSLMPLEVAARTGPIGDEIVAAESKWTRGETTAALKAYTRLNAATNLDDRTREFIRRRLASLAMEQRLQAGGWVDFLPAADDDPNWDFQRGKARRLSDGALEVESGPGGHFLYSRVRVGPEFEATGEFEFVRSSNGPIQAGLAMGQLDVNDNDWYGFRIKRNQRQGDTACLARAWASRQISGAVALNETWNSFRFRFQGGRATAVVNGKEVFTSATAPASIQVAPGNFLLGIGAYNNGNETVVRYRNLRVRKLPAQGGAD
jgi:hypothetical protein